MAAEVLGGGVHDDVGPVVARPVQRGGGQRRVHDHRHVMGVGDRADRVEVHELRAGIRDGFDEHHAGARGDRALPGIEVPGVHRRGRHGEVGQGVVEELGGAAVQQRGGDDVAARLEQRAQGDRGGGLAAGHRDRPDPTLERGEALLEHRRGGVAGTGIGEAAAAPGEQLLEGIVVRVRIGARRVDRGCDGAVHVAAAPACVDR